MPALAKHEAREVQIYQIEKLLKLKGKPVEKELRNRISTGRGVVAKGIFFEPTILRDALERWSAKEAEAAQATRTKREAPAGLEVSPCKTARGSGRADAGLAFSDAKGAPEVASVPPRAADLQEVARPFRHASQTSVQSSQEQATREGEEANNGPTLPTADQPTAAAPDLEPGVVSQEDPGAEPQTEEENDEEEEDRPRGASPEADRQSEPRTPQRGRNDGLGEEAHFEADGQEPEAAGSPAREGVSHSHEAQPEPSPGKPAETAQRSVRELKAQLSAIGLDISHCVEKAELQAMYDRLEFLRSWPLEELQAGCTAAGGPARNSSDECICFLISSSMLPRSTAPSAPPSAPANYADAETLPARGLEPETQPAAKGPQAHSAHSYGPASTPRSGNKAKTSPYFNASTFTSASTLPRIPRAKSRAQQQDGGNTPSTPAHRSRVASSPTPPPRPPAAASTGGTAGNNNAARSPFTKQAEEKCPTPGPPPPGRPPDKPPPAGWSTWAPPARSPSAAAARGATAGAAWAANANPPTAPTQPPAAAPPTATPATPATPAAKPSDAASEASKEAARILPLRKDSFRTLTAWGMVVLNVTTWDVAAVHKAYRTLMRKLHPDKAGQDPSVALAAELAREAKEACQRGLSTQEPPWQPSHLRSSCLCAAPGRRKFRLQWAEPQSRGSAPIRRYVVAVVDPAYGRALTIAVLEPDYNEELKRFVSVEELTSYVLSEEELQKMPMLWRQNRATVQVAAANDAGQSPWTILQVPLTPAGCR